MVFSKRRYMIAIILIIMGFLLYGGYKRYFNKYYIVPVISLGSEGPEVSQIQRRLAQLGFYFGSIDGVYGQGTYEAVIRFQEANFLQPDGIVGPETLRLLETIAIGGFLEEDIIILSQIIYAEGRGEPYEGQVAIGAVVLNRVEDPRFPNTVADVVYQTGAFDAVKDGQINLVPNAVSIRAATDAASGWDPTAGAIYYWNPVTATSKWIWTVPITYSIGKHVFGFK